MLRPVITATIQVTRVVGANHEGEGGAIWETDQEVAGRVRLNDGRPVVELERESWFALNGAQEEAEAEIAILEKYFEATGSCLCGCDRVMSRDDVCCDECAEDLELAETDHQRRHAAGAR